MVALNDTSPRWSSLRIKQNHGDVLGRKNWPQRPGPSSVSSLTKQGKHDQCSSFLATPGERAARHRRMQKKNLKQAPASSALFLGLGCLVEAASTTFHIFSMLQKNPVSLHPTVCGYHQGTTIASHVVSGHPRSPPGEGRGE